MEGLTQYILPELVIVIFVLYFVGMALKRLSFVSDNLIPFLLGIAGILICGLYTVGTMGLSYEAGFMAVVQGILCAGMSVYGNNLIKQALEGLRGTK